MWKKYFQWFSRQSRQSLIKAYSQSPYQEGFGQLSTEDDHRFRMNDLDVSIHRGDKQRFIQLSYLSQASSTVITKKAALSLCASAGESIFLYPQLANTLIYLPLKQARLVAGISQLKLCLHTPLSVMVALHEKLYSVAERPTVILPDVWLGKLPAEGKFACLINDEALYAPGTPPERFYASTEIVIENQRKAPLLIDALLLPMPYLNLYLDSEGQHFSSRVRWNFGSALDPKLSIEKLSHTEFSLVQTARQHPSGLVLNELGMIASSL